MYLPMVKRCSFLRCSAFKKLVRAANQEEEKARDAKMAKAEKEEQAKKKAAAAAAVEAAEAEAAAAAATAEKEKEAAAATAAGAAAKLSAMDLADKESAGVDQVKFSRIVIHPKRAYKSGNSFG